MSNTSYNFKDNLTIDNNKYLKWLDSTGTTRSNIIALDTSNNVNVNSAQGSVYLNSNNSGSSTFINVSNSANVIVASKLGVGFDSPSNVSAELTIAKNGYIGVNTTQGTNDGYLGFSGSHTLTNTGGSRILLYGVDNTTGNSGKVLIYGGNNTTGSVDIFTGNDSRKLQINNNGSTLFTPDGSTVRCSINDATTTFTNTLILSNTTVSTSASTGALQVAGGIGVFGNCFVDGTLSINSVTGNINFDSSQSSTSYTTGAIYISGGLGISNTVNSTSVTSGGGLSVAGGVAIGKSLFVGGNVTILDSTTPTSAQTGSVVLYGGLGINNSIWSRTNDAPQLRLAPVSDGAQTSMAFFAKSNFDTLATGGSSTWWVGQNVGSIGSGNFGIHNVQTGTLITATPAGFVGIGTTNPTCQVDIKTGVDYLRIYDDGYPTISSTSILRMRPLGIELFGNGIDPPYFDIRDTSGNILTRFNSNGSDNFIKIGKLGVGTDTPSASLHIVGNGLFTSTVDAINATTGGGLTVYGGLGISKSAFIGGPILQVPRGNSASRPNVVTRGSIRYNTESDQFEGFGAADTWGTLGGVVDVNQDTKILAEDGAGTNDDNLRFFTAGFERIRVNSSGNIGIGTTSPSATLGITGSLTVSSFVRLTSTVEAVNPATGGALTIAGGVSINKGLFVGGPVLQVPRGNSASRPSPVTRGSIRYNTESDQFEGFGAADTWSTLGGVIDVNQDTKILAEDGAGTNDDNLRLFTAGFERMRVNSSGNIGIGTSAPTTTLDVNGNLKVIGNSNTIGNIFTTGGNMGIGTSSPTTTLDVNGNLKVIGNSNTIGNIFTTGGNIGIGITNPTRTLDANGSARFNGSVLVGSTGGSDNIALGVDGNVTSGYRLGMVKKSGALPTIAVSNTNNMLFQVASSDDVSAVSTNTYSTLMTLSTSGNLTVNNTVNANSISSGSVFFTNITTGTLNVASSISNTNGILSINGMGDQFTIDSGSTFRRTVLNHNGTLGNLFSYNYNTLTPLPLALQSFGGNVGIGTTAPVSTLDVNGNIKNTGFNYVNTVSMTTGSASTYRFATSGLGESDARFRVVAIGGGGHSELMITINGIFTETNTTQVPTVTIQRGQWGGTNVTSIVTSSSPNIGEYLTFYYLTCASGVVLNVTLLEANNVTLVTPFLQTPQLSVNLTYPLANTGYLIGGIGGNYYNYGLNGLGINCTAGTLVDINGVTRVSGGFLAVNNNNTIGNIFTTGGNVGIGNTSPTTRLDVNGRTRCIELTVSSSTNATGVGTGGSLTVLGGASFGRDIYVGGTLTSSSDIRLKENVRTLRSELGSRVLDTIDDIRTIKFSYINDPESVQNIGFIAQDFEAQYPELLRKPHNGYYTLDYQKITVLLMECVKELKHEIADLRSKLRRAVTKFP